MHYSQGDLVSEIFDAASHDLLATVYRVLGIDPTTHFLDYSGRPVALVDRAEGISELL